MTIRRRLDHREIEPFEVCSPAQDETAFRQIEASLRHAWQPPFGNLRCFHFKQRQRQEALAGCEGSGIKFCHFELSLEGHRST